MGVRHLQQNRLQDVDEVTSSLRAHRTIRWLLTLLVAVPAWVTVDVSTGTTTASATSFTYDDPSIASADFHVLKAAEPSQAQLSVAHEESAVPIAEARRPCTTHDPSFIATNTARGGVGPVRQGQAGVDAVAADIEAGGGRVLGREITVEAGGVRTRPDLYVEQSCGIRCFVEVKNGPTAGLTPNQSTAFPVIQSTGGVPVGANAAQQV